VLGWKVTTLRRWYQDEYGATVEWNKEHWYTARVPGPFCPPQTSYRLARTKFLHKNLYRTENVGRENSVGIPTRYGLDVRGSNPRGGLRDYHHLSRQALGFTQLPIQMGTGAFPGVNRPVRGVDHPPHLAPRLNKE
jgi:hypothetical protein